MLISDTIAHLIEEMLREGDGKAEVRRNDLAMRLGCVPSQISYVITSRFTPERGYLTESRRGGGGYIRIVKVPVHTNAYLMHFFCAIGQGLEEADAAAFLENLRGGGVISDREHALLSAAVCAGALDGVPQAIRNSVRADIMRHILLTLMH